MPTDFLLIGAGGLVGRHLREALGDRRVVSTYHRQGEGDGPALDITNADAVRNAIREVRPSAIRLAAADAWVERCEREPERTRRVNVDAAVVIAEEARRIDARLVVFSSDYVFDGTAGTYVEGDARHPINEYGRQKAQLEDIVLATRRALVCRSSVVFGYEPRRVNYVCRLVDRLREGRPFEFASDQLITPTYAPSLAAAVVELADGGASGVVHTAGPRVLPRAEFSLMVAETFALPTNLIHLRPTRELGLSAPRPLRSGLNVDAVTRRLGHPLIDPQRGLQELVGTGLV